MNDFQLNYFYNINSTVYRFFNDEEHADNFVRGKIRVGTFSSIIELSDNVRGDSGEGSIEYYSGVISGSSEEPEVQYVAEQAGISATGVGSLTIVGCKTTRFQDAYLMSLTHMYRPEDMDYFGKYCVRIVHPVQFMLSIAEVLSLGGITVLYDRVKYRKRSYIGREALTTHPALIKPPTPEYLRQNETRMVWIPDNVDRVSPVFIEVENAAHYCRRIS